MDILQILKDKVAELGVEEVAKKIESPKWFIPQFIEGKKAPTLRTCQNIIDLWGSEKPPVEQPKVDDSDGSTADYTIDENGILNASYCPPEWGRKKAAWEGRDVCLCLPVYDKVPQAHHYALLALVMKYRMALRLELRGDDSMITRSRNHLAKRFLDTGATWSVWFDADMVMPFGHAGPYMTVTNMRNVPQEFLGLHTIERLISWKKTVVGGCYWDRRGGGKLIAGGGNIMRPIPHNSLAPIGFNGTGCLAVHRQVFLDIAAKFPDTLSDTGLGNECGFFTNIQTKERMLGEDESFAWRANEAGHPTFLDLGLLCGHIGSGNVHGVPVGGSKI